MRAATLALIGTGLILAPAANASLVGDEMTANIIIGGSPAISVTETVLAGPEATGHWGGFVGYDVEADTISIQSLVNDPVTVWNPTIEFEFLGLDSTAGSIIGATVLSATGDGWSLIDDSDLSWTATSVLIDANEIAGTAWNSNQSVAIQIITPTPGAFAVIGAAGLAGCRRRRRA